MQTFPGVGLSWTQIKDYAHGIQVRFTPALEDGIKGWAYEVLLNGESEDWGFATTKSEAAEFARDSRDSLAWKL